MTSVAMLQYGTHDQADERIRSPSSAARVARSDCDTDADREHDREQFRAPPPFGVGGHSVFQGLSGGTPVIKISPQFSKNQLPGAALLLRPARRCSRLARTFGSSAFTFTDLEESIHRNAQRRHLLHGCGKIFLVQRRPNGADGLG